MTKKSAHRRQITATVAAAAALFAGAAIAGCSQATPALSQCAIVTGNGLGEGHNIVNIARPGDVINIGNAQTVWYYPCDARNFVTAPSGGDRNAPLSVRTGPGAGGTPGMPVNVWTSVYFTPNQETDAMKAFLPFCLKYGCAASQDQINSSNQDNPHFSTAGWEGMLQENMGPAIDRATQAVIGEYGPTLWTDHAAWAKLGDQIAANLNAELAQETGSSTPFFCGNSSTTTSCTPMTVVVSNVTPTDSQIVTEYNQQIEAENALAANTAELKAAKELYGPYASYFLGLDNLAQQCGTKCVIYVGAPDAVPTAAGK
jgi:hypothetical protein